MPPLIKKPGAVSINPHLLCYLLTYYNLKWLRRNPVQTIVNLVAVEALTMYVAVIRSNCLFLNDLLFFLILPVSWHLLLSTERRQAERSSTVSATEIWAIWKRRREVPFGLAVPFLLRTLMPCELTMIYTKQIWEWLEYLLPLLISCTHSERDIVESIGEAS